MKKLVLAAALTATASFAHAGSMAEPMVEAPVVMEDAASSSGNFVVPLLIVAIVAAALSSAD